MEPEETSHTEFDLIVHEPVEPKADDAVHYDPVDERPAPPAPPTAEELWAIYVMIKSVRRGDWGHGDERIDNLSAFGFDDNAIVAVLHEADK